MSHGQSDVERGFSVNKEILQDYFTRKVSYFTMIKHDAIHSTEQKWHDFAISPALYRSRKSAYSNYKIALDKAKEDKEKSEKSLKRKPQEDELHNAKRQKSVIVDAIDALRKGLILEIRNANQEQDMSCVAEAAAFMHRPRRKREATRGMFCKNKSEDILKQQYPVSHLQCCVIT